MADGGEVWDPREEREQWRPADLSSYIAASRAFAARMVPARPAWRMLQVEVDVVHVVPNGDTVQHELLEECVCGPSSSLAPGHEECDHADVWVHQHHALDGRLLPNLR